MAVFKALIAEKTFRDHSTEVAASTVILVTVR